MEKYERERSSFSILRSILNDKTSEVAEKIKQESSLNDFLNSCKTNPALLNKFLSKDEAEKVCKILAEKKDKQVEVKRNFLFSTKKPDGIKIIKNALDFCKGNCDISYISAGHFSIKIKAADFKKANQEINMSLEKIEKEAKEKKAEFKILEK